MLGFKGIPLGFDDFDDFDGRYIVANKLKSNGKFALVRDVFHKKQHPNQQAGKDLYVEVLDHSTGVINVLKLYDNRKGLFFKKGKFHYLHDFNQEIIWIPYQVFNVTCNKTSPNL